jgi:cytidylate kinase
VIAGTRVIAIDGPAASGKSSTAAEVAHRLGALHLDSGALYRGLTRVALDLHTRDPAAIASAADRRGLALRVQGLEITPYLDGEPAEPVIRSEPVTAAVSEIAALAPLRAWVNHRLRAAAAADRVVVLDGRDIGTDVFPEAQLKVYLTASARSRAERRLRQRGAPLTPANVERETRALRARDALDSSRTVAPLRRAADAVVIDTTHLSFEAQVERIVALARAALSAASPASDPSPKHPLLNEG